MSIWDEVESGRPRKLTPEERRARQIEREIEESARLARSGGLDYCEREYERVRAAREVDPERFRAYHRAFYARHREKVLEAKKAARQADPEKFRQRDREQAEKNREKRKAARRARYLKQKAARLV